MDEKNKVLEALGKLPELVDSVNALIDESEKKDAFLAKMAETKVEAMVSEEGMQEVVKEVKETIKTTPCASPDVSEASKLIAEAVREDVKASVQEAVEEKVTSMSIPLEHHHTHATTWELSKYAEAAARKWIMALFIMCCVMGLWIIVSSLWYLRSDVYWGKKYLEVVDSPYTTDEESEILWKDGYSTGRLPMEYKQNPKTVRGRIKRSQTLLKERKKEAKANNGKWSANVPIER